MNILVYYYSVANLELHVHVHVHVVMKAVGYMAYCLACVHVP